MNVQEIKSKYLGDDAASKVANEQYHKLGGMTKTNPRLKPLLKRTAGLYAAEAYAKENKFKNAEIGYMRNEWRVAGRRSGWMTPMEAKAYAEDLLKAVDAIKKAPAVSR